MKLIAICALFLGVFSSNVFAGTDEAFKACNRIASSKQRLACFQGAAKSTPVAARKTIPASEPELQLQDAVTLCAAVFGGNPRRSDASVDESLSTDAELVVTWPPANGEPQNYCTINRAKKTVVSLAAGGKTISGEMLESFKADTLARKKEKAGDYSDFVGLAKSAISSTLKDPSSAQFRNLYISTESLGVLCGEINAKNAYGAYVGFRRFYSTGKGGGLDLIEQADDDSVFAHMWPSMCAQKKMDVN
jgi:hypothetical protein